MRFRFNILLACLAGSIIASLAGIFVAVKYDAGPLSLVLSVTIPTAFCYFSGLHNRTYLMAIAIYAVIGWLIGSMLTPAVAMGPSSQLKKVIISQLAGHDHLLPCVILSSALATCRSFFTGRDTFDVALDDRVHRSAELNNR